MPSLAVFSSSLCILCLLVRVVFKLQKSLRAVFSAFLRALFQLPQRNFYLLQTGTRLTVLASQ